MSGKQATMPVHIAAIAEELVWLSRLIDSGIRHHLGDAPDDTVRDEPRAPCHDRRSALGAFIASHTISEDDRVVLALALAAYLRPALLDAFLLRNPHIERRFTEFGGSPASADGGFHPTLETAAFLVARDDVVRRLSLRSILGVDHAFQRENVLDTADLQPGCSTFDAPLRMEPAFATHLAFGDEAPAIRPSRTFPAHHISTPLEWRDLVLSPSTSDDLAEIEAWLLHRDAIMVDAQLGRHFKPGYRALFHGPPGTGKTLAASLVGKRTGLDVYRVDLSLITSKWVGETEKNLGQVFAFAEKRSCILFFDEADAVFGKRTASGGGQDRYANLEVSYLLQRIEDFPGLVILATNIKGNLDDAFLRRFQSMIYFGPPDTAQRIELWRALFPRAEAHGIDIESLGAAHELTGSTIANVARHAILAARREGLQVNGRHIDDGVRREFRKMGRVLQGPGR